MVSDQQIEVLNRIALQSELLENNFSAIQGNISLLPQDIENIGKTLVDIKLPAPEKLAEQLVEQLMAPLAEPMNQLNDVSEIIQAIPEKIRSKINDLEADIEGLQQTPASLQQSFDGASVQVEEAITYLTETVNSDLIPQWSEVKEAFGDIGETSLSEFEQALQTTLSELDGQIKDTVQQAFERQFGAITNVKDDTEGLIDNTTELAQRIQDICTVLAKAEIVLGEETQRANVGVDKTIETINNIEDALRSKLPI